LIWPLVTSTCFLQWKKNSNGFSWLTRINFWLFWGVLINKDWIPYFRLGWAEFNKWVKVMEATSDDKEFIYIYINSAHSHQRG
jgi:hypothetical protein